MMNTLDSSLRPFYRRKRRYNPMERVRAKIKRMIKYARKPMHIRLAIRQWRRRGLKPPPKLF